MVMCEAINCNKDANHIFTITLHSNIYSGLYEVNNKTRDFHLCKEHYERALVDSKKV